MNVKLIRLVFSLGCLLLATSSFGADPAFDCEGCTQTQYYSRALQEAQAIGVHGPHAYVYVYDLNSNQFLAYQVGGEPGPGGTWNYELTQVSASATQQDAFNTQRAAIEANGGGVIWFGHVNSNQSGFPYPTQSAFNVALTPAYVTGISNWILFNSSSNVVLNDMGLTALSLANSAFTILLKSDIVSMQITVTFTDGSYVVVTWHAGQSGMTMTGAFDVNNNPISIPPNEPTRHYVFPHGGIGDFTNYMNNNYGMSIPNVPTCVNGFLACSHVVGTGAYSCIWVDCGSSP